MAWEGCGSLCLVVKTRDEMRKLNFALAINEALHQMMGEGKVTERIRS